ncbi:MAG: hypothetical protein RLZZ299_2200 [Pseudomonadota bacterium]|jgi:hypothetical protein
MSASHWLALFAGCSDWGLAPASDGGDIDAPPRIVVTPEALDFGILDEGASEVRTVVVRNDGPATSVLEVRHLELDGAGGFTFVDPPSDFRLPSGIERALDVLFAPAAPDVHEGVLVLESDDPERPTVAVPLVGNAPRPELRITPDPLDFGAVEVGCATEGTLTLENTGTWALHVRAAALEGEGMTLVERLDDGFAMAPGATRPLRVRFEPTRTGDHAGALTVTSDEALRRRTSLQRGTGTVPPNHAESFHLSAHPAVDLLFFVDQSWSMRDDQVALADNFGAFIARIDLETQDWRVMVVNSDSACTELGVLDRTTPGYDSVFRTAVQTGGGSRTEAGLGLMADALDLTGEDECNRGFLRDDALLHVVFVTDEPDHSPGPWEDYVARMRAARGRPGMVRMSAVSGTWPTGCTTLTNSAEPGRRYHEAVQATGGVYLDICAPWAGSVDALADASVRRDTFPLAHPADADLIEVRRNGARLDTGWSYRPGMQAVVFDPASVPREGDHVEIRYRQALACP